MDGKRRKTEKENIPKATPISLPCPPLPPLNISTISSTPPSKIGTTHRPPSYLQSPISTYAQQSHAVDIVGRLDMMEEKMDRIYRKLCTINVANNQQEEDIKELKLLLKRTPEFITAKEEIDVFPIKSVEEYEEVVQKLVEPAFRRLLVSISDCWITLNLNIICISIIEISALDSLTCTHGLYENYERLKTHQNSSRFHAGHFQIAEEAGHCQWVSGPQVAHTGCRTMWQNSYTVLDYFHYREYKNLTRYVTLWI